MNAATLALDNIDRYGEYLCFRAEGRDITNVEQQRYAGQVARALGEHGVEPGDRVLVMMPNAPETLAVFFGAWMIGAAVVPVAPQLKARETEYVLRHSGARLAVTVPERAPVLMEAGAARLLVFGPSDVPGAHDLTGQLAAARPLDAVLQRAPSDLAVLLYTSGTTALPKGVILTHQNLIAASESCSRLNPDPVRCSMLQVLPLSHVYGLLMFELALAYGFTSIILPRFDVADMFKAIQQHRVARVAVVPAMMVYLIHHPERPRYDTSSLRHLLSGGGPLPEFVRAQFEEVFHCPVRQGYGLSETSAIASGYADTEPYRLGSSGHVLPLLEIKIVDPEGTRTLAPRERGEICVRGPAVSPGYWNDPEATAQAFCDGWLRTGDVGYLDEDGYLYVSDRKKDLIIKGGENVSPREIEEVIHQHPAVAEAAVIGIPDETFGENICAVVVLKPGAAASPEQIREHTANYVMKFKVPTQVVFRPALPKNLANKVLKRELRREFSA